MRTKTLLLTAAALLAAGFVSTQAQPVYSQNIVGYASIPTPAGKDYLITVPFQIGVSNFANDVFGTGSNGNGTGGTPTIPDGSSVLIWTGSGYTTYFSDSGSPSLWDDYQGNFLAEAPVLAVGQGFFLIPAASTTNTFAGTVVANVGTVVPMVLPSGKDYLVGSVVPYAGAVTNGNSSTGGLNLSSNGGLPDGSSLLIWNGAGYTTYFSDSGSPSLWDDYQGNFLAAPPTIAVGQGFFIIPAGNFTWNVGL